MKSTVLIISLLVGLVDILSVHAQSSPKSERAVTEVAEQSKPPSVKAIAPIDDANVFFLTTQGTVGVAKFSPGLSLIGWETYSEIEWNALADLAVGPEYSLLLASPREVTQAFETNEDPGLDFYQAIISDWPGREAGVRITAGPVADGSGRLLFALSAYAEKAEEKPKASIVAWQLGVEGLTTVTRSQLPIADFVVGRSSLLAARLLMPGYDEGYFISLTSLPTPEELDAAPYRVPNTLPSLLVPAELTQKTSPSQLSFFLEDGVEKLLLTCPESHQLVEIVPRLSGDRWQGSILLRSILEKPAETLIEMSPGQLLAGGESGFFPIEEVDETFRVESVELADDGIVLAFSHPVDRLEASKPESYSVQSIGLDGGKSSLSVRPVIESDGLSVILRTPKITDKTVLRILCQNVPSESGATLLSSAVFYTIHQR